MRKSKYIRRIHLREKTLLTKRDFAAYLGVHVDTITRWHKWGYLPKPEDPALHSESKIWLWKYFVIKKWLEDNCVYGEIVLEKEGKEIINSLLNIKKAALLWNVSESFLVKWYYSKECLPYLKIGFRVIRFERRSLREFMIWRHESPRHRVSLYMGRKMRYEKRIEIEKKAKEKERQWIEGIKTQRENVYREIEC